VGKAVGILLAVIIAQVLIKGVLDNQSSVCQWCACLPGAASLGGGRPVELAQLEHQRETPRRDQQASDPASMEYLG